MPVADGIALQKESTDSYACSVRDLLLGNVKLYPLVNLKFFLAAGDHRLEKGIYSVQI